MTSFMVLVISLSLLPVILAFPAAEKKVEAQVRDGYCPDGSLENPTNKLCYKFINDRKSFSDAEDSCLSIGGHLAVVDSLYTNDFLAQNAASLSSTDFWIGAIVYSNYSSKPWVWTDSYKLLIYSNWKAGEPSGGETSPGQCAAASVLDGTWTSNQCVSTKPYVCNIPRVLPYCPSEWVYLNVSHSCYKVFFWASWQDAESACQVYGAHLTSIHSKVENEFINYIAQHGDENQKEDWYHTTWIGLFTDSSDGSGYRWSDGSPTEYIDWFPGEPNDPTIEKCGLITSDNVGIPAAIHRFGNFPCSSVLRNYVCKKPANSANVV